jgi:hypothetical protein
MAFSANFSAIPMTSFIDASVASPLSDSFSFSSFGNFAKSDNLSPDGLEVAVGARSSL